MSSRSCAHFTPWRRNPQVQATAAFSSVIVATSVAVLSAFTVDAQQSGSLDRPAKTAQSQQHQSRRGDVGASAESAPPVCSVN
jgi:hypothetical protein